MVAGQWLSAALTSNGTVFSWGRKWEYFYGAPYSSEPTLLPGNITAVHDIQAGSNFFIMLTLLGEVYTFGSNYNGL